VVGGQPPVRRRTQTALAELLAADLSAIDPVAILVDGVSLAEQLCVVALVIHAEGRKHPVGLRQGRPRTPPWSVTCWPTCASGAWR